MDDLKTEQGVSVLEAPAKTLPPNGNGGGPMVATAELPIAKYVTNDQKIAEEKFLEGKEAEVGRRYTGVRGWFRIFHVSAVIGKLALYLYLDQYETHRKGQLRYARERMRTAQRLTRAAVYGEKLYGVRLQFLHWFMLLLRRFFIGSESSKQATRKSRRCGSKISLSSWGRPSSRSASRWERGRT